MERAFEVDEERWCGSRARGRNLLVRPDCGCKLVNDYENRYAPLGYRLLDTLQAASTIEFTYPRVTLAKALAHGWGTPPRMKESARLKRAKSLLELVGQSLTECTWANDESYTSSIT